MTEEWIVREPYHHIHRAYVNILLSPSGETKLLAFTYCGSQYANFLAYSECKNLRIELRYCPHCFPHPDHPFDCYTQEELLAGGPRTWIAMQKNG